MDKRLQYTATGLAEKGEEQEQGQEQEQQGREDTAIE